MGSTGPAITLYTNHRCPWAHRAHIVIKELGLPYDEVIIDLDKPREPWYLEVNPRGLVPSIKYNNQILTESSVVSRFLADAYPSHLVPNTGDADAAFKRARINFFVDTWFDKINPFLVKDYLAKLKKEIEPLLQDAAPFFGGSGKITLAEALTAPFVARLYSFAGNGLLPGSVLEGFESQTPKFDEWAKKVVAQESVNYIYDEQAIIAGTKKRLGIGAKV
ncbi:Glutathione S-transferase omega-1 [Cyphellophora attinorum]|uniref:Glutathione S-transferase omega-1 n=1 Tax=Cyphellophora attinorum TaxID=1664694 RepID=A0A0N1P000_9EURO|nr:Glutathione S-transferase omega-1 [Phialophora attinorum]KPI38407.1 Glutathione S-transferase omega-1 [Phialophora attinorum]